MSTSSLQPTRHRHCECGGFLDSQGHCNRNCLHGAARSETTRRAMALAASPHLATSPRRPESLNDTAWDSLSDHDHATLTDSGYDYDQTTRWMLAHQLDIDDITTFAATAPDVRPRDLEAVWWPGSRQPGTEPESIIGAYAKGDINRDEAIAAARHSHPYKTRRARQNASDLFGNADAASWRIGDFDRVLDDGDRLVDIEVEALDNRIEIFEQGVAHLRSRLEALKGRRSRDPF